MTLFNSTENDTKKERFRYLDAFFYKDDNNEFKIWLIIKDLKDSKIYALNQISFENVSIKNDKTLTLYKNLKPNDFYQHITEEDKGSFCIDKELLNFYLENNSEIEFNSKKLTYGGYIDNLEKINKNTLYNLNKENNLLLLENAIFINGSAKFDIEYNYKDTLITTNILTRIIIFITLCLIFHKFINIILYCLLALITIDILIFLIDYLFMKKKGFLLTKAKIIKIHHQAWMNQNINENSQNINAVFPTVEYTDYNGKNYKYIFGKICRLTKFAFIFYKKDKPQEAKEGHCNFAIEELINNIICLILLLLIFIISIFVK